MSRHYEKASLILTTSNKSFIDWGDVFGDPVLATAILDRLLHHATTINIKGESYRLKEKRRAGLLQARDHDAPTSSRPVGASLLIRTLVQPRSAGLCRVRRKARVPRNGKGRFPFLSDDNNSGRSC